jgi:hypothetical protein
MGFEAQSLDSDSMLVLKPTYNNNNNNINSFYYSQYSNNIGFSTSGRRGHSCFFSFHFSVQLEEHGSSCLSFYNLTIIIITISSSSSIQFISTHHHHLHHQLKAKALHSRLGGWLPFYNHDNKIIFYPHFPFYSFSIFFSFYFSF